MPESEKQDSLLLTRKSSTANERTNIPFGIQAGFLKITDSLARSSVTTRAHKHTRTGQQQPVKQLCQLGVDTPTAARPTQIRRDNRSHKKGLSGTETETVAAANEVSAQ